MGPACRPFQRRRRVRVLQANLRGGATPARGRRRRGARALGAMRKSVSPPEAAGSLRDGKVVLVPTETVVGLVAAESGLARIREIKGRDADKPIALLCASSEEAFALAASVPPLARKLASLYWPGPLTLVLDRVGGGTVGVRVPADSAVRAVLAAYGGPLYATSAN